MFKKKVNWPGINYHPTTSQCRLT